MWECGLVTPSDRTARNSQEGTPHILHTTQHILHNAQCTMHNAQCSAHNTTYTAYHTKYIARYKKKQYIKRNVVKTTDTCTQRHTAHTAHHKYHSLFYLLKMHNSLVLLSIYKKKYKVYRKLDGVGPVDNRPSTN